MLIVAPWMPLVVLAAVGCGAALMWVWRVRRRPPVEFDLDHDVRWWLWHYYSGSGLALEVPHTNEDGEPIESPWRLVARSWPWLHIGKAPDEPMGRRLARAAGRTTLLAAVLIHEYLRAGMPWGSRPTNLLAVGYAGALAVGLGALAVAELATHLAVFVWWKRPAAAALADAAGWDRGKWPGLVFGWVRVQVVRGKFRVRVRLHPSFKQQKAPKQLILDQTAGVFEMGEDPDPAWHFRSIASYVWVAPARVVPHLAAYSEPYVYEAIEQYSGDGVFVPAIGRGNEPVSHHLDTQNPHGLLSASTIGGKSETLMVAGAQLYRHGAYVAICDIKMSSHRGWAIDHDTERPLPGICYADESHEIANVLIRVGQMAERRNAYAKQLLNRGLQPDFDRIVLLLDEMNGAMAELRRHGHEEAIHYYRRLLWMGRVVKVHIMASGQRMDADAAGGGAARECYGLRMLAEYSEQTYGIVAPQAEKIACVPHRTQPGWCVVVYGREAFEAQRVHMLPTEAQQLALRRTASTDGPRHGAEHTPPGAWAELHQADLPALLAHGDQDRTSTGTWSHGASAPGPEGPGGMGPDPQPYASTDDPSAPKTHSPHRPGQDVPAGTGGPMGTPGGVVGRPAGRRIPDVWHTLREIAEGKMLPVPSLNALRQQSKRQGFPEGRLRKGTTAKEYPIGKVVEWWYVGRALAPENRDVFDPGCYWIVQGSGAEDPDGTTVRGGTRRRGVRWGDTAKVGRTEDLPQRCRSYTCPLDDVVLWQRTWGEGDRRDDPAARVQASIDYEDLLHDRYRHERLYAQHELFEVKGQLARDLGVPAPVEVMADV